ncbi:unnamed protein product [marine sediment metagenome]|uniref:CinA C-terminal domain-containing protein n=1 Tax=marine sediment metagenome TaxID=412755 RepID=X0Z1N6_9ZZZZ
MKYLNLHSWEVSPQEAIKTQKDLKSNISLKKSFSKIDKIAGADVSYYKNKMIAGIVILKFPQLKIIERQSFISSINFPYIPGLLTFREGPSLLAAFKKIKNEPDIILFDGQGIAHPRRMGIATHLGLFLDKPTIGCAKSRLSGKYASVGEEKGDYALLKEGEEVLGAVLRTRRKVKPIFVSPGHKIDLSNSIEIVLKCTEKYKLPIPVREAHLFVNQLKNNLVANIKANQITATVPTEEKTKILLNDLTARLKKLLGNYIYRSDDQTLEEVVGNLLKTKKLKVAVAESCTGGMLGEMITRIPGSSKYFQGGVISYNAKVKEDLLKVPPEVIRKYGEVSKQVAKLMAEEVRKCCHSDIGISITGIAGPGGATEKKKVGLVYMTLTDGKKTIARKHQLFGDRQLIRSRAARRALNMLRNYLSGI